MCSFSTLILLVGSFNL